MSWNNYNDDRRGGGGWGNDRNYSPRRNNDYGRNNGGRGYNNYNEGYNDNGGRYRDDGYNQRQFKFQRGDRCHLTANPDIKVNIIRIGREQYECRLPNLNTGWFYEDELELDSEPQQQQ
jgi:hypothetical protein